MQSAEQPPGRYLHDVCVADAPKRDRDALLDRIFSLCCGWSLCEIVGLDVLLQRRTATAWGQAYFTQALRLAREVGDYALSAYLMTSITHQALHVGQAGSALRVAKAARNVAEFLPVVRRSSLRLTSWSARSHCTCSEQSATRPPHSTKAEQSYELIQSAEPRAWEPQWDEIMFASHAGTCWNDLGNTKEARRHLTQVWEGSGDRPRRRIYSAAELGIAATRERRNWN